MAKKADSKIMPAWYVFDLREPYSFCGELSHSVGDTFPKGFEHLGFSCHLTLIIETRLARTNSKKVKQGMASVIEFHIRESTADLLELGIIEKHKDKLMLHAWVPDRIANHIHLTLMSSKPQLLQFYGTDLYYREGKLKSLYLQKEFDEDELC